MKTISNARFIIRFLLILIIVMTGTGLVHFYTLEQLGIHPKNLLFIDSYLVNFILGTVAFVVVLLLRNKASGNLAYVFFAGSVLKAIVFLAAFKPRYSFDGELSVPEFMTFFIPFSVGLVIETYMLVRALNKAG